MIKCGDAAVVDDTADEVNAFSVMVGPVEYRCDQQCSSKAKWIGELCSRTWSRSHAPPSMRHHLRMPLSCHVAPSPSCPFGLVGRLWFEGLCGICGICSAQVPPRPRLLFWGGVRRTLVWPSADRCVGRTLPTSTPLPTRAHTTIISPCCFFGQMRWFRSPQSAS